MGPSLQWRQPPPGLRNRRYGATVSFGRGNSAGAGYMAASSRVGPGVLVLDESASEGGGPPPDYADALNEAGFTALTVDLPPDSASDPEPVIEAAASFLADNWHPRLGVVAFGRWPSIVGPLVGRVGADAFVAYIGAPAEPWDVGDTPSLVHVWGSQDDVTLSGGDLEVHPYDGSAGEASEVATAFDRTLDFLTYHLS